MATPWEKYSQQVTPEDVGDVQSFGAPGTLSDKADDTAPELKPITTGKVSTIIPKEESAPWEKYSAPKEESKQEEGLLSKIKEATIESPVAKGAREAVTHPAETLSAMSEGIKQLFSPEWQKQYKETHGKDLSKEEQDKLYDVALNWMPVTELVGSIKRMKDMMPSGKEEVKPTTPQSAEDIVKAHSNINRLMKEDSSGSMIVDTQRFINESQGIKEQKPSKIEKKEINTRREEVRAAFDQDKDYADYLRSAADERIQLREQWAKTQSTREADKIEKQLAENKDYTVEIKKPEDKGEVPWADAFRILTKPGFLRDASEKVRLSSFLKEESGTISPEVAFRLASASAGGITGAILDPEHPIESGLIGAAIGLGGLSVAKAIPKALQATKEVFKGLADTRFRIDDLTNAHDYHIKQAARSTMQATTAVRDLVKDESRRTALAHWLEGDRTVKLSNEEMKAAQTVRKFFNDVDAEAIKAGVYDAGRENYVTHIWDFGGQGKSKTMEAIFGKESVGGGTKRFAKERSIPTLQEGIAKGLTPKTTDVASIMDIYSQSMFRAIENKKLVDTLKNTVIPTTSEKLLTPIGNKIPVGYKILPGLPGYAIHPDIEGPLRVLFENYQPNVITRAILGLNMATKRLAVSYSLFHAKALTDAYIGAGGSLSELAKMPSGSSTMLKQLKAGGAGDLVDQALKGGIEISHPTVDVDPQLLHVMVDDAGKFADKILPFTMGEKVGSALKAADKKLDTFMWERLHTGMKLEIFGKEYEKAILKNAEAHAKDPSVPLLNKDKIAQDVASYTNDLFGGLNWNRIFNESQTKVGRSVMMAISSPSGKAGAQILMFAPDWTLSTTRAAYKAFRPDNELLTKLHRRYLIRSALYYLTVAEGLNQAFSGHSVLDNKDPTRIDMGDGRTMQFSKHAMEPVHWFTDTTKQAFNKLGFVPKELMEQKEMVSPIVGKRILHVAKKFAPISAQTSFSKDVSLQTVGEAGLSFLGMPIYGKTEEQKRESDRIKRKKRRHRE